MRYPECPLVWERLHSKGCCKDGPGSLLSLFYLTEVNIIFQKSMPPNKESVV